MMRAAKWTSITLDKLCFSIQASYYQANTSLQRTHRTAIAQTVDREVEQAIEGVARSLFYRPLSSYVQDMELVFLGYLEEVKIGWMRHTRQVFSLKRPTLWKRLWRSYPLLLLRVRILEGVIQIDVSKQVQGSYVGRLAWRFYLSEEQLEQLQTHLSHK
jgi:hypothetical protein